VWGHEDARKAADRVERELRRKRITAGSPGDSRCG
jgi:hypothetical protein